jgi:hypothetical protein
MAVVVNNPPSGYVARNYGNLFDTTTQTNPSATGANVMTFNTVDIASGVSVVNNSRITIAFAGVYNINFSAQFSRPGGTGFSTIKVWMRKNGVDIDGSAGIFNVPQSGGAVVASWDSMYSVNSGDYYEFVWSSTDTTVVMNAAAAGTNPTSPTAPSIAVTVMQLA